MLLPEEARQRFFKLHTGLLAFVDRETEGKNGGACTPEEILKLPPPDLLPLRDALWGDPKWVARYVEANPDGLSPEELEIVSGWRHFKRGSFCIFKQLKKHAVFIEMDSKDPRVFGVLALTNSLEEMLPEMPVMVENAVLLPFQDVIIYDGILAPRNILFGRGIRNSMRDWYNEAKARYGVITQLPFDGEKNPERDRERLAYYLRSERNREHYADEIAELVEKSEDLNIFYHQEIAKSSARHFGKRLREAGVENGFFGIFVDTIVASGDTREALDRNLAALLPESRRPYVYVYQLRRSK
ncbi:MAG: hypothetical protein ACLFRG_19250 [Desulfococcaceae bacterium]